MRRYWPFSLLLVALTTRGVLHTVMCATTLSVVAASLIAQSRYWCRGSESTWGICILNAPTRSCTHRRCGRVTSDALARGKAGALRARPPPRESVLIPPGGWHLSAQPLGACRHSGISEHGPADISMHAGSLTRGCLLSSQSTLHVVEPRIPSQPPPCAGGMRVGSLRPITSTAGKPPHALQRPLVTPIVPLHHIS